MQAASATPAFFHVNVGSDSEEEVPQLTRRSRASRGDPVLGAKNEHLKTPSQSSLPPQRPAPAVPGERMVGIQDIRLKTQPTEKPAPNRPAPPISTAGNPVPQAGNTVLKTEAPSLLERQRPAPISTAPTRVAEPADDEVWSTPPQSPSDLLSPAASPSHASLSSLSLPSTPSSLPSPSWPSSPEAHTPVRPSLDTKGKGKAEESPPFTPPAARASTSAAPPVETGQASPTEAVRHPADVEQVGKLANLFAEDLDQLRSLKVPSLPPFMKRNDLVNFNQFLDRNEYLLDTWGLREAQVRLRDVLANGVHGGVLRGVSEARLEDLRALSTVNVENLSRPLSQLKSDFAQIRRYVLTEQGGDPALFTRRERPLAEIQAERDRELAEFDAAIKARQYPMH